MTHKHVANQYCWYRDMSFVLLLYWIVLVIWQNLNPSTTGSVADTVIKVGLLLFLSVCFIMKSSRIKRSTGIVITLFFVNMLISFAMDSTHTFRSLLVYFFPVLFLFLTYGLNGEGTTTKKQLLHVMKIVIAFVAYMALYSIFFKTQKFISALSISSAYGNELSAFFSSNHEYALYLTVGIVCCLLCLRVEDSTKRTERVLYLICIPLFSVNLILTFSRSYILMTLAFVTIYVLHSRQRKLQLVFWTVAVLILCLTRFVPALQTFVVKIVFKGNTMSGRDVLAREAIEVYRSVSLSEKIWGIGSGDATAYFSHTLGHSSVHNAYLQVLLNFGGLNFVVMFFFLLSQITSAIKTVKIDRVLGVFCLSLNIASLVPMITNTATIFTSPCDSYFLTMFTIIIPKYIENAVRKGTFYD